MTYSRKYSELRKAGIYRTKSKINPKVIQVNKEIGVAIRSARNDLFSQIGLAQTTPCPYLLLHHSIQHAISTNPDAANEVFEKQQWFEGLRQKISRHEISERDLKRMIVTPGRTPF
jgi:hypothetical protein